MTTRCCIQLPWEAALNLKENKPGALSARGVVNLMEKPMNLRVKFNSNFLRREFTKNTPGAGNSEEIRLTSE